MWPVVGPLKMTKRASALLRSFAVKSDGPADIQGVEKFLPGVDRFGAEGRKNELLGFMERSVNLKDKGGIRT